MFNECLPLYLYLWFQNAYVTSMHVISIEIIPVASLFSIYVKLVYANMFSENHLILVEFSCLFS